MIYAENFFPRYDPNGDLPLNAAILVLDHCNMLSVAATVDPMRAVNRKSGRELFQWKFCTPFGDAVRLTSGVEINGPAIGDVATPDILFVVAGFRLDDPVEGLEAQLRKFAREQSVMAGIDGGTWMLARSGILDDHRATTHWEDFDNFQMRFPRVDLVQDRFCVSQRRMTTGGASPCIDMMLSLISHLHGPALAARVAGVFIYDADLAPSTPQQIHPTRRMSKAHPLVARAIDLMQYDLSDPPSIDDLAKQVGVARRTLEMRFQNAVSQSPSAYLRTLRLAEAHRLATDSHNAVQDIAEISGFSSHAAFARAFQKQFGTSVSALRKTQ